MMIPTSEKKYGLSLFLIGSLFILSGCLSKKEELQNKQQDNGSVRNDQVLLSIDGKPVLYAQDFEDQKLVLQQTNQQMNMLLQVMPDAEYNMLFKSIEAGLLMKEWVIRQGIDKETAFAKEQRQYRDAVDAQLYAKYFVEAHPVHVSNDEARKFYLEKRDQIPGLIIAQAGVDIVYAQFDNKAKAEGFLARIKDGSEKHFKAAAKEADIKVESMVVSQEAEVSEALKQAVLGVQRFPTKDLVKVDDRTYWVIGMIKKQEAQYRSFDEKQIEDGIKKMCENEKREKELMVIIDGLKAEFNAEENIAYFENKKQNQAKALQKAEQLVLQTQQASANQEELEVDEDIVLNDKI